MRPTFGLSVAVATVVGLAVTAESVSAFSIDAISPNVDPFAYTATGATQTFKLGASGPTVTCSSVSFAGTTHNVAGNFAATDFTPTYLGTGSSGSCNGGALGNTRVVATGKWRLTATSGSSPTYGLTLSVLAGSFLSFYPMTVPSCQITIGAAQNGVLTGLSGTKDWTGTTVTGSISGFYFAIIGGGTCPGVASTGYATYNTVSGIRFNGVTINP